MVFRWPSVWACLLGASIQIAFGLVPTSMCFVLLVAADSARCPLAVGAERMRPFYAWLLGVVVGIIFCQLMTGETRTVGYSWVICGSLAVPFRYATSGLD